MKTITASKAYSARHVRRYPNEAEPSYFTGKLLDGLTAAASYMGTITLFFYFLSL